MGKTCRAALLPCRGAIALALSILAGCGGAGNNLGGALQPTTTWPTHGYEGAARSAAFAAVAVDSTERRIDPLTQRLHLDVRPDGDGTLVRILGRDLTRLDHAYLHLKYDNTALHPELTRQGEWIPDDTVFLGITNQPGLVVLGLQISPRRQGVTGDDVELAAVRFAPGGWQNNRRISSVSPTPVADLHFDTTVKEKLVWSYTCKGDYDQNSEVGISDLTPIGIHFHATSTGTDWAFAQPADGDANGEVNVADLQPIGVNYHDTVTGYQVKTGPAAAGPFSNVAGAALAFDAAAFPLPATGGYRQFSLVLTSPAANNFFAVVALSGTEESTALSNVVQYSVVVTPNPPQNLAATNGGLAVHLTWQLPLSGTPDGYNCYVANAAGMTSAIKMNAGSGDVTNLTFDCPLAVDPAGTWYFAVKAVYSGVESGYSNIFAYNVAGASAPTGLQAILVGTQVELTWTAVTPAPDGYNAYVGTDAAMTGAVALNTPPLPPAPFDCPAATVDPAAEHYFGVKATTGGSETGFSNIAHYSPAAAGDTTPPVWQQGMGIKAATPDAAGGMVLVSWYVATDAQTPPVQYQFYVEPEGTPIDWNNPADVFASTILQTPVTQLADGTPLQNGQRYQFAVRAVDAVVPTPNQTTNTNFLYATPQILPPTPTAIPPGNPLSSSDTASVRLQGEEVPRIIAVNHSDNLYYIKWDSSLSPPDWTTVDLTPLIGVSGRKYQPAVIAIGDEVHLLFATSDTVYETYGMKDDPANWQTKIIMTPVSSDPGIQGEALCYSPGGNYLACVFAADSSGTEQLFYSDRDLAANWSTPLPIMDGTPMLFQCDMAISTDTGEQFVVASNGSYDDTHDNKMFWYVFRPDRTAAWGTPTNSTFGSDVMSIAYDYSQSPAVPLVASATVRLIDLGIGQDQPVTDATIYTWTGNAWGSNTIEKGDATFEGLDYDTKYAGQDSRIIFSPTLKAIAIWSFLDVDVPDVTADEYYFTGKWNYTQRPAATWSPAQTLLGHFCSSNSVTAGDSFEHCLTCDLGLGDGPLSGAEATAKYSDRTNYPEGNLYYLYKPWN